MSATITLTVTEGPLTGREFIFRGPAVCRVGRASDCSLRLPSDDAHGTVSRHHCLLEIDPPLIRVCDLGSLNGTYVNGLLVGKRGQSGGPDEPALDCPLHDGDTVQVGPEVLCVAVQVNEPEPGPLSPREEPNGGPVPCVQACEGAH
jgi:pSer/pThr/pTyr-binding forkhead associated (FHA) protein